jgi:hypothetical protein
MSTYFSSSPALEEIFGMLEMTARAASRPEKPSSSCAKQLQENGAGKSNFFLKNMVQNFVHIIFYFTSNLLNKI